jgi:hypothetical protein
MSISLSHPGTQYLGVTQVMISLIPTHVLEDSPTFCVLVSEVCRLKLQLKSTMLVLAPPVLLMTILLLIQQLTPDLTTNPNLLTHFHVSKLELLQHRSGSNHILVGTGQSLSNIISDTPNPTCTVIIELNNSHSRIIFEHYLLFHFVI